MPVLGAILSFPVALHVLVLGRHLSLALALMAAAYAGALAPALLPAARKSPAAALGAAALLLAFIAVLAWQADAVVLLYLPPVAINLWFALLFGASLRRGSLPLVSRIARLERGTLEPELAAYTRRLTAIWTLLFLALATESLLLALFAPLELWSWFVNVWNYVFVGALFVGEYAYRRLRYARYGHASPLALIRLIRAAGWQSLLHSRSEAP
jgi:uncharacterized membrane protein